MFINYCDNRYCGVHLMGGPSEREYREKLDKIKRKLNSRADDLKNQFEKIEKAKVDLLKKTKEIKHDAEHELCKMEDDIVKSKDLAPESKRRLKFEVDILKGEIREKYTDVETRIAEAIVPS